jgi:hypothetical protein
MHNGGGGTSVFICNLWWDFVSLFHLVLALFVFFFNKHKGK